MVDTARPDEVVIAPNQPIFDLPEIVAIERGLFEQAGLSVRFADGSTDDTLLSTERDPLARLKESLYEAESADVYNLCEWGGIDRLERNQRGGRIAYLRPAVVAQALVSFDPAINEPHDLADIPVGVNEFTGSHYTALHLLEGTLPRPEITLEHIGSPAVRLERARTGQAKAVMLMEPYISLALKQGGHIIGSYFYRGSQVIAPNLSDDRRAAFIQAVDAAVDVINADPAAFRAHITANANGELENDELRSDYYRYTKITPFTEKRFSESYSWMKSWRLTEGKNSYDSLLAAR
jgi:NitT/TauT family transport system substrate-binding protein